MQYCYASSHYASGSSNVVVVVLLWTSLQGCKPMRNEHLWKSAISKLIVSLGRCSSFDYAFAMNILNFLSTTT